MILFGLSYRRINSGNVDIFTYFMWEVEIKILLSKYRSVYSKIGPVWPVRALVLLLPAYVTPPLSASICVWAVGSQSPGALNLLGGTPVVAVGSAGSVWTVLGKVDDPVNLEQTHAVFYFFCLFFLFFIANLLINCWKERNLGRKKCKRECS